MSTFITNLALVMSHLAGQSTDHRAEEAKKDSQDPQIPQPLLQLAQSLLGKTAPDGRVSHPLFKTTDGKISPKDAAQVVAQEAVTVSKDIDNQIDQLNKLEDAICNAKIPSPKETRQILDGLEIMAQRYTALGEVPLDNPAEAEALRKNMSFLAATTYRVMTNVAECSPYVEINQRAPLYSALQTLSSGDLETAEAELKKIRSDFPEADEILKHIEGDRRRAINNNVLEVWKSFIDEREAVEIGERNSILGHTVGFATWAASGGKENSIDRCHAKWNARRDVLDAVKKRLDKGDSATLEEAISAIAQGSEPRLKDSAQEILSGLHYGGWGKDYRLNAVSYLVGYASALNSGDQKAAGEFSMHLLENADHLAVMDGAVKTSYGIYSILEITSSDEKLTQESTRKMQELETGHKSIAAHVWDEIRTTGTDDLALMAIMGAASKAGRLSSIKSYRFLRRAGMGVGKARWAAIGAGFAAESHVFFGLNTLKQAATHDISTVFSGDRLLKSYAANLITLGFIKKFGVMGGALGKRLGGTSSKLPWLFSHGFSLGGMISANQVNQRLKFAADPTGGFKESLVKDVFGYFKFAVGPKVFEAIVPAKPRTRMNDSRSSEESEPLSLQAQAFARQAKPAKRVDTREIGEAIDNALKSLDQYDAEKAKEEKEQNNLPHLMLTNGLIRNFENPGYRRALEPLLRRKDALGVKARDFLAQVESCLIRLKGFKALSDRYAETGDVSLLDEMAAQWKNSVEPSINQLKSSTYYRLKSEYEQAEDRAHFQAKPFLTELSRQQDLHSKDESMTYEYRFKSLEELNLDPRDPVGSLQKISIKDLIVIKIKTKSPEVRAKVEKHLKESGYLNLLKMVLFENSSAAAP